MVIRDIVKIITDLKRQCNENVKKITKLLKNPSPAIFLVRRAQRRESRKRTLLTQSRLHLCPMCAILVLKKPVSGCSTPRRNRSTSVKPERMLQDDRR
jgi:hypothetical protein